MAKMVAGGAVAPNNSPLAAGGGKGSMPAGTPSKPPTVKGGFGFMKTSAYPSPAKGGGKAGDGNGKPRKHAGSVTAHPRSRKPMAR